MSNEETGNMFGTARVPSDPTKAVDQPGAARAGQARALEDALFTVDSMSEPPETPFVETSSEEGDVQSADDDVQVIAWDKGAADLFGGPAAPPPPPAAPATSIAAIMGTGARPAQPPTPRSPASMPGPMPAAAPLASTASAPRIAVVRPPEAPPTPPPAVTTNVPEKHRQSGRPKPTSTSYVLSVSVLAAGIGCGALLWMTLGSMPLAIVSAALGAVGAVFSFVLASR